MHVALENETEHSWSSPDRPGQRREAVSKRMVKALPLAPLSQPMASTSAFTPATLQASSCCSLSREETPKPARVIRSRFPSLTARTTIGTYSSRRHRRGKSMAYRVHGTFDPAKGNAIRSREASARPLWPRRCRFQKLQSWRGSSKRRQCSHGHEERGCRSTHYDWEGDTPLRVRHHGRLSMRCMFAVSPDTPVPASQRTKRGTYAG